MSIVVGLIILIVGIKAGKRILQMDDFYRRVDLMRGFYKD